MHHQYWASLLVLAQRWLHNKALAEEVVEDVFIAIWQQRTRIIEIENIDAYLYKSVKNKSLNKLASEAQNSHEDVLDAGFTLSSPGDTPLSQLLDAENRLMFYEAVANLPPRCQTIFRMVREQGLSYKQVAAALSISAHTVNAQMAIAVKRLAAAIRPATRRQNNH